MSKIAEVKTRNQFLSGDFSDILADKGFSEQLYKLLRLDNYKVARLAYAMILRQIPKRYSYLYGSRSHPAENLDYMARQVANLKPEGRTSYRGTSEENVSIDRAIKDSTDKAAPLRAKAGNGATPIFRNLAGGTEFSLLNNVPALILGGGPAGILAARALGNLGFQKIQIIDKHGELNGIWRQPNVSGLSKNNPFRIQFMPRNFVERSVNAAPGPGSSIVKFLTLISHDYYGSFKVTKGEVTRIYPGDLSHLVFVKTPTGVREFNAPIVINCMGGGSPIHPNDPKHMATPSNAGIRWQRKITVEEARLLAGKTLGFIGLGNSTAEMMVQLERFRASGIQIDYKVYTHHPHSHLMEPEKFGIFRDIKEPNLTKLAGDLPEIRAAYWQAMANHRIRGGIHFWDYDKHNKMLLVKSPGVYESEQPCEQLYVLIGYAQEPQFLEACGMLVTERYKGIIAADYDGEVQRFPGINGRPRVHPGYFALGAMLKSSSNPNAEVIPGIMHRLYDLSFSAALRGLESTVKH